MKKIILSAAAIMLTPGSAFSCEPVMTISAQNLEIIKQFGGLNASQEVCDFLKKKKLVLNVAADSSSVGGIDVAWAKLSISDAESNIVALTSSQSHSAYAPARNGQPERLRYENIKKNFDALDITQAANDVFEFRKRAKAAK